MNFIQNMLQDVDKQASSKRFGMLWMIVIIWSFVHIAVFLLLKDAKDLITNLIFCDMGLIAAFGGLALAEKVWGRPKGDKQENP